MKYELSIAILNDPDFLSLASQFDVFIVSRRERLEIVKLRLFGGDSQGQLLPVALGPRAAQNGIRLDQMPD